MPWQKAPEALKVAFDQSLPDDPRLVRKPTFGYPSAIVNGHMVAGLHEDRLVLRLPEPDQAKLIAEGGTPFEPMPGRPMRGFVVAPAQVVGDPEGLRSWVERAFEHGLTLAPKEPGAPRKKK